MGVYAKGRALIIDKNTGEAFQITSDELDWEPFEVLDNAEGEAQRHEARIDHPVLGTLTWTIWEFPEGVERMKATNSNEHEVQRDFEYGLVNEHQAFIPPKSVTYHNGAPPKATKTKAPLKAAKPKAKAKAKPKAKAKAKKKPVSKKAQNKVTKPKKAKKAAKKKAVKRVTKSKKRVKKKK